MRFSIRDILWLTVVAAVGLGWWLNNHRLDAKLRETEAELRKAQESAELAWHALSHR